MVDRVPLQLAEPASDLIQPGGIGRREVPSHAGVLHDVHLAAGRLGGDHLFQERDEFLAGMALAGLPSMRSQRSIQRQRSVAIIFESMLLGPTGR